MELQQVRTRRWKGRGTFSLRNAMICCKYDSNRALCRRCERLLAHCQPAAEQLMKLKFLPCGSKMHRTQQLLPRAAVQALLLMRLWVSIAAANMQNHSGALVLHT